MDNRQRLERLQLGAGILTWALVTGIAAWIVISRGDAFRDSLGMFIVLALVTREEGAYIPAPSAP